MSEILRTVLVNSLWIVGLAVLLAAFSYYYDRAQHSERPLREQLSNSAFSPVAWTAFVLICAGLAATSTRLWESVLWIVFTFYALYSALGQWRSYSSRFSE